jgi:hypothetical protein
VDSFIYSGNMDVFTTLAIINDNYPKFIADMRMRILSPSVQICPQYDDFSFTNWDLNEEVCQYCSMDGFTGG